MWGGLGGFFGGFFLVMLELGLDGVRMFEGGLRKLLDVGGRDEDLMNCGVGVEFVGG